MCCVVDVHLNGLPIGLVDVPLTAKAQGSLAGLGESAQGPDVSGNQLTGWRRRAYSFVGSTGTAGSSLDRRVRVKRPGKSTAGDATGPSPTAMAVLVFATEATAQSPHRGPSVGTIGLTYGRPKSLVSGSPATGRPCVQIPIPWRPSHVRPSLLAHPVTKQAT
jgi:hypothetical protein